MTDSRWAWVSWGFKLKLIALSLLIFMLLAIAGAAVVVPRTLILPNVNYAAVACFLPVLLLDFAGQLLCMATPVAHHSRAAAGGSIGCQLTAIILLVAPLFTLPELSITVRLLTGFLLAGCAQALVAILFMLYARDMSISLGRPDLAGSPKQVLWFFGLASGSFTTASVVLVTLLVIVLICPCLWWLVYVGLAVLEQSWRRSPLPMALLWPLVRLVPILLVSLVLYLPLYRYGKLLWQLGNAVDRRRDANVED